MYAGFITTKTAVNWLGVHQKLNKKAYKLVKKHTTANLLPVLKDIQHFEGYNGPDGIKVKSPSEEEPWHFYSPEKSDDTAIFRIIENHYQQLVKALNESNSTRSAFETSWLSHTVTDGLTPAHHYPYEDELTQLRGDSIHGRSNKREKVIIKGVNKFDTLIKNWKAWGAKGVMSTHINFEAGVASVLLLFRIPGSISDAMLKHAKKVGIVKFFEEQAHRVNDLRIYERFYDRGWTLPLMNDVRIKLAPIIVESIAIAWLMAISESNNS